MTHLVFRPFGSTVLNSRDNFISTFDKMFDDIARRDFPELFQHWGAEPFGKSAYPKVNVISHDESVTIEAELAGYKKDEIDNKYSRLIVSRPVQPMGKDIGFLPGTLEEKMSPWLRPIQDNLQFLMGNDKITLDWLVLSDLFTFSFLFTAVDVLTFTLLLLIYGF